MSDRFKNVLANIFSVFVALVLFGGLVWAVSTLVSTTSKANAVVSFLNKELAAQQQQTAPATVAK